MTPAIKQTIYGYIKALLPKDFEAFWANERRTMPKNPYCMLISLIPEQPTHRTTERELEDNINEVTMYKNTVVTVSINVRTYFDGEPVKLNELNALAHNTAVNLKNQFETQDSAFELNFEGLSCNVISELRDLTTPIEGGYHYRYEFDLTFGYNEVMTIQKLVGQDVILNIKEKNSNA